MRNLNAVHRKASAHGEHVGAYAAAVLEHRLPWTKMRQVYRLLGLVRRHRAGDDACRRALDSEVVDVDRMLSRGTTGQQLALLTPPPAPSRFVRSTTDFAVRRPSWAPPARCGTGGQPIDVSPERKSLMRRSHELIVEGESCRQRQKPRIGKTSPLRLTVPRPPRRR